MKNLEISVLVIDDDRDMLYLCIRILKAFCSEVEGASSSAGARKAFHRKTFDLVLTDINIDSAGSGVDLSGEIRNISPCTSIIMMTADPTIQTAIGGIKAGAMEYLVKPFSPVYLESVVRNTMEKSRLYSELEREKSLKAELESAYSQLKNSERAKDAFLGRINHELRTPLAIAMGSCQLLSAQLKDEKERELWTRGDKALKHLHLIIEELLLFSDLLKGGVKLKKADADLRPVLEGAVRELAFLSEGMGVSIALSFEGEPYLIPADKEILAPVFKQLLTNAVKFNTRGGSVEVKAAYLQDKLTFSFKDTGCAVSDEDLPRIFYGFFQAADYLTRGVGGIGLGLATVKHITEAHGGGVEAQKNQSGPGMTFTIWFPRK